MLSNNNLPPPSFIQPKPPDISTLSSSPSLQPFQAVSSSSLYNNMIIDTTIYAVEPYKILPTSYLHTLLSHNISTPTSTSHDPFSFPQVINDELDAPTDPNIFIPLSFEEKERIYKSWRHAMIIKLYGQKIGHQLLRQKILCFMETY